jgi:hypothetical protein
MTMQHSYAKRSFCAATLLMFAVLAASAERIKRPMHIHRVAEIGLEIWTEVEPRWEIRIERQNGQAIFQAETPALTYPPAGMTWLSMRKMKFSAAELEEGARGAIHAAARNYQVASVETIALKEKRYGDLTGFEAMFSANAHGTPVDVQIFLGHQLGKPAVLMHAYTLKGKLDHISEQIRRSWNNVKYL